MSDIDPITRFALPVLTYIKLFADRLNLDRVITLSIAFTYIRYVYGKSDVIMQLIAWCFEHASII